MYCQKCGKEINDDATVCIHCGAHTEKKEKGRLLSRLIKIPTAVLAWFTLLVLLVTVENAIRLSQIGNAGNAIYVLSILILPVIATILLFRKNRNPKPFYQKLWFWAIAALLAIIIIGVTADPVEQPNDDPTGSIINVTENNALSETQSSAATPTQTTAPPETTPPETTPESTATVPPETTPATTPAPDPAAVEAEYKASCQVVDYKDLCRYPDDYAGTTICIEVKIYQIMDAGGLFSKETAWRGMTDNDGYEFYLDNEYYLLDKRPDGAVKVLVDDIVVVYGEFAGLKEITRALTFTQEEIPCIEVKYVDIIE